MQAQNPVEPGSALVFPVLVQPSAAISVAAEAGQVAFKKAQPCRAWIARVGLEYDTGGGGNGSQYGCNRYGDG